jgi:hypothetical protein
MYNGNHTLEEIRAMSDGPIVILTFFIIFILFIASLLEDFNQY